MKKIMEMKGEEIKVGDRVTVVNSEGFITENCIVMSIIQIKDITCYRVKGPSGGFDTVTESCIQKMEGNLDEF